MTRSTLLRSLAMGVAALLLLPAGGAQAQFSNSALRGVYAFYTDDNDQTSTQGVIQFDGAGSVTAGTGTIRFLSSGGDAADPSDDVIGEAPAPVTGGSYSLDRNGLGEVTANSIGPDGSAQDFVFAIVVTRVNNAGKVTMARMTLLRPSLAPALDPTLRPAIATGFIERIPPAILPNVRVQ